MAITSVRLPAGVLRKPDAWMGLWGALRGIPASYKLCASWNRYLYFSSARLNASNYKTLFHDVFSLRYPGLLISPKCIFPLSIRLKSNMNSKKSSKKTLHKVEDEEDSDEERDPDEMSEQEEELEDDPSVVKDYKDLDKVVQSLRYDVIMKTGLDVGRNKVEDAFYKGELRLNGEKLWKKSRTVKVGDTLDLVIGDDKEAETETVMRILLKKVFEEKTESEKYRVVVRRWKKLKLPKKSVSK
ncbi:mitochondrial transcription rescue factor 1 isoform X2 [Choloepus didactylus]|nr:mitochondrial transcription rescue factor 1 isoform X2 [Choloepus didactylus]XP_037699548.1 mitochondrial transcription rescue factor 1 isoform X2 [Choloepus didactylus]XP_037699549.1 mitochondrial transcription rescue factor 1 isoform X2 [Choloepus didactylus]XP_037699551.1 mitochondrial transcription rescue factor 1 isoform X2 [Choloepus didactylus]XP_037699552.1 mitochondrial transcription rescue factor 1 isoform X2 [Choloepus didactylus]XP_037699553.1 mitochondrial transcription rescue 